jgi:hypothetical protein
VKKYCSEERSENLCAILLLYDDQRFIAMKAARIIQPNKPLEVQEMETPRPKGTQVLVKILSSGVCHQDY